jgi:hypothetical protein
MRTLLRISTAWSPHLTTSAFVPHLLTAWRRKFTFMTISTSSFFVNLTTVNRCSLWRPHCWGYSWLAECQKSIKYQDIVVNLSWSQFPYWINLNIQLWSWNSEIDILSAIVNKNVGEPLKFFQRTIKIGLAVCLFDFIYIANMDVNTFPISEFDSENLFIFKFEKVTQESSGKLVNNRENSLVIGFKPFEKFKLFF